MEIRLLPIVVVAASAALGLKTIELLIATGDRIPIASPAMAQTAPATTPPATAAPAAPSAAPAPARSANTGPNISVPESVSAADQLAERLGDRRRQLEDRSRELDMRENLLRSAEARVEQRMEELRRMEQRVVQTNTQVDDQRNQQMRGLVVMYEAMRAKDAARIFDRLDMEVLLEVVTRMRPAKVADVLAEMQPDPAKRLTTELARRSLGQRLGSDVPQTQGSSRELQRIDAPPGNRAPASSTR